MKCSRTGGRMNAEMLTSFEGRKAQIHKSLLRVVDITRGMEPCTSEGDWGKFAYNSISGNGALYVPFGADGIAAAFLSCGGEIGENNLKEAMLTGVFAAWSGRVGNEVMRMVAVLLPYRKMTKDRLFAYYLQGIGNKVILDAYGSPKIGWWSVSPYALPLTGVEVEGVRLKPEISYEALLSKLLYIERLRATKPTGLDRIVLAGI